MTGVEELGLLIVAYSSTHREVPVRDVRDEPADAVPVLPWQGAVSVAGRVVRGEEDEGRRLVVVIHDAHGVDLGNILAPLDTVLTHTPDRHEMSATGQGKRTGTCGRVRCGWL